MIIINHFISPSIWYYFSLLFTIVWIMTGCSSTTTSVSDSMEKILPNNALIQYFGRWDMTDPKAPKCNWVTYMKVRFSGTSIGILLDDGGNDWTYSIDGDDYKTLVTSKTREYILAENLSDSDHDMIFVKRTEAVFGIATFHGFLLDKGKSLLPVEDVKSRKIEFIGDSISAGLGNEGQNNYERPTENANMAYGPITARTLNAEWMLVARSGIGLTRSYGDNVDGGEPEISDVYSQSLFNVEKSQWDFSKWSPDVVIIFIGTNDYSTRQGQRDALDIELFKSEYTSFYHFVRGKYPDAHFITIAPFFAANEFASVQEDYKAITSSLNDERLTHLSPVISTEAMVITTPWLVGPGDFIGDWTHPTVKGHQKLAEKLSKEIAAIMGW